jgi:Sodium:sulfate symporter transmembrane region
MKETDLKYGWTAFLPIVIAISIALMPMPQGLSPHAWYYFAIFAGLIAALVVEPLRRHRQAWPLPRARQCAASQCRHNVMHPRATLMLRHSE